MWLMVEALMACKRAWPTRWKTPGPLSSRCEDAQIARSLLVPPPKLCRFYWRLLFFKLNFSDGLHVWRLWRLAGCSFVLPLPEIGWRLRGMAFANVVLTAPNNWMDKTICGRNRMKSTASKRMGLTSSADNYKKLVLQQLPVQWFDTNWSPVDWLTIVCCMQILVDHWLSFYLSSNAVLFSLAMSSALHMERWEVVAKNVTSINMREEFVSAQA